MAPIWSRQPFTLFYTVLFCFKIPFIILLSLRYSIKALRPVPQWSTIGCTTAALIRGFLHYSTATRWSGISVVQSDHIKAKERFSLAQPAPSQLFTGVLKEGATKPTAVGGVWYPSPLRPDDTGLENERVILHFPGGAFVLASGFDRNGQSLSKMMTEHTKATKVFFAQYRPASSPATRFPAAVQDSVTFYNHILSLGVKPSNIILSGDSAGGNLVIALLRYLEEHDVLPKPSGAMVWSPWVHVTANAARDYNSCPNAVTDFLTPGLLQWGADAYLPDDDASEEFVPYISPLHHPFKTNIPLFIHAGKAEAFHESVCTFAQEITEVNGKQVRLHVTDLAPHDIMLSHEGFGMTRQLGLAIEDADNFFEEHCGV